jgi:hypothetical protein
MKKERKCKMTKVSYLVNGVETTNYAEAVASGLPYKVKYTTFQMESGNEEVRIARCKKIAKKFGFGG